MRVPRPRRRSDEALLADTARDGSGFAEFYERHERTVLVYMLRRTRDPELAADLTAEVFAAALAGAADFRARGGSPAVAWLFGIARNILFASYRRARVVDDARRRLELPRQALEDPLLERIDRLADDSTALAHLDLLPADQREAIRAYVLDERDYPDIAAELRCSEAVVRKRVSRGLSKLRDQVHPS